MQSQFPDWLNAEKVAGRGGLIWPEPIVRGLPWEMVLPFPVDVSADSFRASFASAPDASPLVTLTEGSGVTVGSYASSVTEVTIALSAAQVATIGTAQGDGDSDGLAEVLMDLHWQQGSSGDWARSGVFSVPVSGVIMA